MSTRAIVRFSFRRWAAETGPRSLSIRLPFVARSPITRAPVLTISAFMLRVTLGRRRLTHPRRQHFQVDQFV